jgi:hypothetical protein
MFLAQELRDQLAFALDAENSDHYRDDLDYIPAINAAIKWLTSVVNSAYGKNKIGEEFFRELSHSGVFQTSDTSRVSLDAFPNEVWTILAVYALPETEEINGLTPPTISDLKRSYYLNNLLHLYSTKDCKRLNIEEWAKNKENPLEAGYEGTKLCDALKRYAYLAPINYQSATYKTKEIEIRPSLKNQKVTIFWAKKPDTILGLSNFIPFPSSVFQLLFDKALNYISYKQGDQTNLYTTTERDIQQLISVI